MIIEVKPEDELLVQKRLESGVFGSVEEVIHRALHSLEADEFWLQREKDSIHKKIEIGIAQLERGEGLTPEEARASLDKKKTEWIGRECG